MIFILFLVSLDSSLIYALIKTIILISESKKIEIEFFGEPFIFWPIMVLNLIIEIIFTIGISLLLLT